MNFFQLPIGAGLNDPVVGEVDGAKIRMAPDGTRYYEQFQPPARQAIIEALTTTLDDQGRAVHDRAPQAPVAGKAVIDALIGGAMQGLTAPGRALRGEPVTYGDAWATALDYGVLSAPTSAPEGALRGGGIRAYHGSPHDFDKFSMDAIGTGEGAQAYGHGLYFAESEDVARGYRDDLSRGIMADGQHFQYGADAADAAEAAMLRAGMPEELANEARWYINRGYSPEVFIADLERRDPVSASKVSAVLAESDRGGHMYEVNINANPDDFLDWDAPLSEQSESARKAIQPLLERYMGSVYDRQIMNYEPKALGDVLGEMDRIPSRQAAQLLENGAPGIKYKDGMSRGAEGGTRNFVVFDENLIEIVRKYGIAGAAAYLGMPEDEVWQRVGGL